MWELFSSDYRSPGVTWSSEEHPNHGATHRHTSGRCQSVLAFHETVIHVMVKQTKMCCAGIKIQVAWFLWWPMVLWKSQKAGLFICSCQPWKLTKDMCGGLCMGTRKKCLWSGVMLASLHPFDCLQLVISTSNSAVSELPQHIHYWLKLPRTQIISSTFKVLHCLHAIGLFMSYVENGFVFLTNNQKKVKKIKSFLFFKTNVNVNVLFTLSRLCMTPDWWYYRLLSHWPWQFNLITKIYIPYGLPSNQHWSIQVQSNCVSTYKMSCLQTDDINYCNN